MYTYIYEDEAYINEVKETYQEAAKAHKYASQFLPEFLSGHLHLQSFWKDNGKPTPHHLDKT